MNKFVTLSMACLFLGTACSASDDASESTATASMAIAGVTVVTGPATQIGQVNARLGLSVSGGPLTECGVCWGPAGSGANFVTQTGANGVRCMRQIPCLNAAYYTSDGYMAQAPYVPGATYEYKAYASNGIEIQYGNLASFSVPKVNTGDATEIGTTQTRLGVTVDNLAGGAVSECGVCWGPNGANINFVTQLGSDGVRCMRQIPCLNAAYYTSDGYMTQRPYVPATTYSYRGYAINDAGVAYGQTRSFTAAPLCYNITGRCWAPSQFIYAAPNACGSSAYDAFLRTLPTHGYPPTKCDTTCPGANGCCCELASATPLQ
jgi:hypothetical protein